MAQEVPTIQRRLERFKSRGLCILSDDSHPQSRAVLVAPAKGISPDTVNQILRTTGGLFFVAMSPERVESFMLERMARPLTVPRQVGDQSELLDMCVSVEAREGITTGISAADRAATISILGEEIPNGRKLVKPGHIFPVQIRRGGLLTKNALPEGAFDVVRLASSCDAALFVDLLSSNGDFSSATEQEALSRELEAPQFQMGELVRFLLEHETHVYKIAEARLPTESAGELRALIFRSRIQDGEHLALIKGDIGGDSPVLTRVQTEFTFSDVFGGSSPPTRHNLLSSLKAIGDRGRGVLIYLRRPFRGQLSEQIGGWEKKIKEKPASMMRDYGLGAQILRSLGVHKIELITNSKKSLSGITTFGIDIVSQIPMPEWK